MSAVLQCSIISWMTVSSSILGSGADGTRVLRGATSDCAEIARVIWLSISVLSLWVLREATPEGIRVPEKTTSDCAGKVTRLAPDCIGLVTDASRDGTWVSAGLVPVTVWVVSDAVPDGTWVLTGETWVGNFVKTYAMHRAQKCYKYLKVFHM